MTTIDELGRRAAAAANAVAARDAAALTEAGLERLQQPVVPTELGRPARRSRRWVVAGLVAAGLIATGVVVRAVTSGDETQRIQPTDTGVPETVGSSVAPQTTDALAPSTTVTGRPAGELPALSVRYDALPPAYPAVAFASIPWPRTSSSLPSILSDNHGGAVVVDHAEATATPWTGQGSAGDVVPLADTVFTALIGPQRVLYGIVQGGPVGGDFSLVAIPLDGPRAGAVVASTRVSTGDYVEAPANVLGRGATGIIDRRTGATLLGYVDSDGAPTPADEPSHPLSVTAGSTADDMTIHDPDGAHDWRLAVERDPAWPGAGDAGVDSPPAASSHGGAIVVTSVGPAADPTADIQYPTVPVVAVLAADGTGSWYSLADGWVVAASDVSGTILSRYVDDRLELARLDPPQRFDFLDTPAALNQRPQFAITLPTSLTTAPPCTVDQLAATVTRDGAMGSLYGTLLVHNTSPIACAVSGVPDVALVDDGGEIVQSTDASVAATTGPTVVLVPNSWARAFLGRIGSNVCGGQASSRLQLTLAGNSSTIDFANGRPFDAGNCDPSNDVPNHEGGLMVEPFGLTTPNDGGDPFAGAALQLTAPTSAAAGSVVQFDLAITGGEIGTVLTADDCPIYEVSLGSLTAQYLLNCDERAGGVLIDAGETVVFHLQLALPADLPPGPATLTWTAAEPAGASVTAPITITITITG